MASSKGHHPPALPTDERVLVSEFSRTILANFVRRSRDRVRKKLRLTPLGPWMRPQEEAIVVELLHALQPTRCLEWGAGYSTLHFPALLPRDAHWLSVEHNAGWAAQIRSAISREGTEILEVAPSSTSWEGDGDRQSFERYLGVAQERGPFDFILIDGRARSAALAVARKSLTATGIVVLHDANRDEYASACDLFPVSQQFRDRRATSRRPFGGIWIGSIGRDINSVLDVEHHRRIWNFYGGIGRLIA